MNHTPTTHAPGTPAKQQILADRAALGLPLFHPQDKDDHSGETGAPVTTRAKREAKVGKAAARSYLNATNSDSPYQHMVCGKCQQPVLVEYWEWSEIEEDKLQCPNCLAVVKIGKWIDGVPEKHPMQKCLICSGTGNA